MVTERTYTIEELNAILVAQHGLEAADAIMLKYEDALALKKDKTIQLIVEKYVFEF